MVAKVGGTVGKKRIKGRGPSRKPYLGLSLETLSRAKATYRPWYFCAETSPRVGSPKSSACLGPSGELGKAAQAWDDGHFWDPCDLLPSTFFSIFLSRWLLLPPTLPGSLHSPHLGSLTRALSLFLLPSSPGLSNGL